MRSSAWRFLPGLLLVMAGAVLAVPARAAADSIAGIWLGQKHDGHAEIRPCGQAMCGYVISILDPTLPPNPHDVHNEHPNLQSRPICGLQVLGDLKAVDDAWEGWVYDPYRGKTFSVEVKLDGPNTLKVHGYLGVKLMGETQVWTRAAKNVPRCSRPAG